MRSIKSCPFRESGAARGVERVLSFGAYSPFSRASRASFPKGTPLKCSHNIRLNTQFNSVANDNLRKKIIAAVFKLELRKTLFAQYVLTHFSKKWAGCRGGAPQEKLPYKL